MAIRLCTWLWRGLIALVFLQAAWTKWERSAEYIHPVSIFERTSIYDRIVAGSPMRHYGILASEVLAGVWILSGLKPRWSAIYTATLLTAYIVVLGYEIRDPNPQVCDCGIRLLRAGNPRVDLAIGIVRNIFLMLGCGWIWLMSDDAGKPTAAHPAHPAHPAPPPPTS